MPFGCWASPRLARHIQAPRQSWCHSPDHTSHHLPLAADGIKGTLAYSLQKRETVASVNVDRNLWDYNCSLKATYNVSRKAFVLQASRPKCRPAYNAPPLCLVLLPSCLPELFMHSLLWPLPSMPQETWKVDKNNKLVAT